MSKWKEEILTAVQMYTELKEEATDPDFKNRCDSELRRLFSLYSYAERNPIRLEDLEPEG